MNTPALFVGHGSPMNAITPGSPFNQGFAEIAQSFPKPRLILCISAHWYGPGLHIASAERPEMIYDFFGFPQALGEVVYPAPGDPTFAQRLQHMLAEDGATLNAQRGFDHGAWAVLKFLYPDADIPVVQMSIDSRRPAPWHYALAKKLRPLRDEGVLILGSGDIVHNLRAIDRQRMDDIGIGYDWAFAFRDYINQAIQARDEDRLIHLEKAGTMAALSVPTPEHYLPLLYVMAQHDESDGDDGGEAVRIFNDELVGGSISMTSVLVGGGG